ncbi:MAG: SMC-Scp complex subunit ScpB [archaeon]
MEAALFISPDPLSIDKLKNIVATDYSETMRALENLKKDYENRETSLEINKSEEKYELTLKGIYFDQVGHLATGPDLKKAELRTLGLISMRQPIKQSKVAKIIGNKAYRYIGELERKGFVETTKKNQTKEIKVTDKFKKYFGKSPGELKEKIRKNM